MSATGEPRQARDGEAGATLIETLAAVAVLGAVAAIAFPRLEVTLLTLARRQTAAMAADALRQARAQAIARDTEVAFVTASGGRTFGPDGARPFTAPPGVTVAAEAGGGGPIVFFGDGSSSGGVARVRAGSRTLSVEVAASGGAVRLEGG